MITNLPTGTVTFLFTDIEGSTKLAQDHRDAWESLRARHHAILQSAMEAHNGYVFQIIGDAFCTAFHNAGDALRAALRSQDDLLAEKWEQAPIKVRMGIHTGKAEVQGGGDYQGYLTMSRVQRVMSVAYGGQILVSNTSYELIRGELPEGISLLDMKEHRLKGLINPEHLWQVVSPNLPGDFPPLQSLNDIPNNLPIQLTSFIGREKEIAELKGELNDHHIVTLTGSGGTGKTRLSLEVAANVIDSFPDGVWFLELAPVTDPALVPNALGNLLGLRESGETKQTISELVCSYLHSRKVLLVLDNCEHLIDSCARFADLLLRSCKDLKILASSREALGVEGEMAWHVPSLALPDINHLPSHEQISQYEAVRLFIERAMLVQPHFAVTKDNAPSIAQVCFRLDGIPLALELAAARSSVLTVEQISKRLDDRFRLLTGGSRTALPRQQTLRAMIDWSYNLLAEEEQLLFRRLAVFVGGWTLEAAEAVCSGDGIGSDLILDLLAQLVHKSLVVMAEVNGESRYHCLETIRQYGREKLFETEEAAHIRNRQLDYFIQLAEQGYIELQGPNDLAWIEKIEAENDNLRTALNWSLESLEIDPQKTLQLSGALRDFWDTRGYTSEGYRWLSEALSKAPDLPTIHRCRALHAAGLLAIRLSHFNEAVQLLNESLNLAQKLNDKRLIILDLLELSHIMDNPMEAREHFEEGVKLARETRNQDYLALGLLIGSMVFSNNVSETIRYCEEAREIAIKLGNARLLSEALWNYGGVEMRRNNFDHAIPMLQESLRLDRLLKDQHGTAHSLLMLGRVAARQADHAAARQYEVESLQILRDLSDRLCALNCLFHLGWNDFLAGEQRQAIEYFEEALAIGREYNLKDAIIMPLFGLGRLAMVDGNIPKARSFLLEAMQVFKKTPDSPYYLAYTLEAVSALPGLPSEKAAQFLGRSDALREQQGHILPATEQHLVEPVLEKLQAQLGKEGFDSALAAGAAQTVEQTIDEAIEALEAIK